MNWNLTRLSSFVNFSPPKIVFTLSKAVEFTSAEKKVRCRKSAPLIRPREIFQTALQQSMHANGASKWFHH